tara:strand:+ start:500 stop:715 length:216 start_codon:yes stop_codon:yes gene_type:complete
MLDFLQNNSSEDFKVDKMGTEHFIAEKITEWDRPAIQDHVAHVFEGSKERLNFRQVWDLLEELHADWTEEE